MAQLQNIYSDLDLRFIPQPGTKDVSMSYDTQAVIRSVTGLLLTKPYERLWSPTVGSGIDSLLFEPISNLTATLLQNEIIRTINNWEPRATIATIDVVAAPDQNGYSVSLFFYVGNNTTPTGIQLILQRSR
jgi:phage baseplate assembly protein W